MIVLCARCGYDEYAGAHLPTSKSTKPFDHAFEAQEMTSAQANVLKWIYHGTFTALAQPVEGE